MANYSHRSCLVIVDLLRERAEILACNNIMVRRTWLYYEQISLPLSYEVEGVQLFPKQWSPNKEDPKTSSHVHITRAM
ncbi:hypothetical protein ACHAWO_002927 [Cyclotella atomus]|uniref:Uncharacterized protein n=1 Tax=Cyclotella atomus TaxID=382360 RepID=A0ABD3QUE4_9STRA